MPAVDKLFLLGSLCPPLDPSLTEQLLDEFVSQERRFVLQDFEPSTLDGGQFTEAAARILYHADSGTLQAGRSVNKCLEYVEDSANSRVHLFPDRKSSLHITKVLRTIYKFRSDRGAVHIDAAYSANHVDSKLVLECTRWVLAEVLRIFWTGDRKLVAKAIREIVEYEIPVVGNFEGRLMIQRTDCTAEEEIVILLHHAGELGLTRTALGQYVAKDASTVTRALKNLASSKVRQVVKIPSGHFRLTDLGTQRVLTQLADKLLADGLNS